MFQPRTTLLALAATGTLLLSGCGAGAPGVAVRLDGDSIPMSQVEQVVETMCSKKVAALWLQGNTVTGASQKSQVAIGLAFSRLADAFAEEQDLDQQALARTLGPARTEIQGLVGDVDEATQENLLAQQKLYAVRDLAGRTALVAEGAPGEGGTDDAATAKGADLMTAWLAEQDVEFDPRLGVELRDGQIAFSDSTASFPVSDLARAASADEPAAEYVGSLPENQRCG